MNCPHCNDTGSLSKQTWGQLDCGYCDTALERMRVEAWARRVAPMVQQHDVWTIYQHGKQAGATQVARTGA
jgi:transcription elongation factor Elf1